MTHAIELLKDYNSDNNTVRNRIYRQNVRFESEDLLIQFPFHGQPAESDGKLKIRAHEHATHPEDTIPRRNTIRCHYPQCPKDNILWTDYKNRVPYLEGNGDLIPSGWWKLSVERIEETINKFREEINDELNLIRDGDGIKHGYKDRATNDGIDGIIRKYFPKGLPNKSKTKIHNILWHMLTSLEGLRVYHLMVSPPQDHDYVSQKEYKKLKTKANRLLIKSGAWGAMVTMHHARVKDRFNNPESPSFKGFERKDDGEGFHFHAIAIGFFDYEEWKDSGWIVKNISFDPDTKKVISVKSIRATATYLLEHCSIVSKKINGSLSCLTTVLTTSDPNQSNTSLSNISGRVSSKNPTYQKPNELKDFQISIVSGSNEITEKSHIRKIRNYNSYWFLGCLKKIKLEKKKTRCAYTGHEIEKNTEFRVILHAMQEIKVPISHIATLEKMKELEIFDPKDIDSDIQKIKEGKLKIWVLSPIDPLDYEKYMKRIRTGVDRVLDGGGFNEEADAMSYFTSGGRFTEEHDSERFSNLFEQCKRFRLSDPNYAWFKLPHDLSYTDILSDNASAEKIKIEVLWHKFKQ